MSYTPIPTEEEAEQDVAMSLQRNRHSPATTFQTPHSLERSSDFLLPLHDKSGRSSIASTANTSPSHSRAASPSPLFLSAAPRASSSSDTESDSNSPLLLHSGRPRWSEDTPSRSRWWPVSSARRNRPGHSNSYVRAVKRGVRRVSRHPFVPKQPIMILLTLLLFTAFGISLTFLIIHILNPDKEPLPWRFYCSIPSNSTTPPALNTPYFALIPDTLPSNVSQLPPPFPPDDLDSLTSAGVFLGVFSLDSSVERRMLIRSTYASHQRSREGGAGGDEGLGTSRTIVRFILGQPSREWDRRVQLEMEEFDDIVILPMHENMNSGKTHAYFTWAASSAWVPPHYETTSNPPIFSYSNATSPAPPLAKHDPIQAWHDSLSDQRQPWVRPDFVAKVDDDAFVMLAELEARLRVQLHDAVRDTSNNSGSEVVSTSSSVDGSSTSVRQASSSEDPNIYWGYLVKNRFMAGELYALSWSLVHWVANDPNVKAHTKGAEDKQTAKWMRSHPRADEVRWASERCWIYDHPRAGTVYAHGYLFPSEVSRVKKYLFASLDTRDRINPQAQAVTKPGKISTVPSAWSHSSVSTFGARYTPPLDDLTIWQSVEALVEGSHMSRIREDTPMTSDYAWDHREGMNTRYAGKRVGGTVVVHFIKKNMWFLETALALLDMDEVSELERNPGQSIPTSSVASVPESTSKSTHYTTSTRMRKR